MENGYTGISNNDVATLATLAAVGNANYHDGSVLNANINRNAELHAVHAKFTRETIREQGVDARLAQILQVENDMRREVQDALADARAEAAKCCCETKELVLRENNATRTLMLEQRIAQQDNAANIIGQQSILSAIQGLAAAISSGNGHGNG